MIYFYVRLRLRFFLSHDYLVTIKDALFNRSALHLYMLNNIT